MSQPLLFVNPDDGLVYKVTGREVVELSRLDEQIANTQEVLDNLKVEREKFVELSGQTTTEDSQTPAEPEQPLVPADNPPAQPEAPVDAVPNDQPIGNDQGEAVASTEVQSSVDATPSDQPATPAFAA